MNRWIVATLGVAGALATGCGGSDPSNAPGATQQGVLLGTGTPSPDEVSITGFVHASDGTLLGGGTVCLRGDQGTTGCIDTGTDGAFSLHAPSYSWETLTFQHAGYLPVLRPIATQDADIVLPEGENALMPIESPQTFMGAQAETGKGHIEFFVLAPGSATPPTVVATLSGSDGSTSPTIYLDSTGAPASGAAGGTSGGFANLVAGMYVLRFSAGSAKCTANGAYGYPLAAYQDPTSGEAAVVVPVEAGTLTAPVGVTCTR